MIDTHAHLSDEQFDADRAAVIQRAAEKGIATIIEIADSPESWEKARRLCQNGARPNAPGQPAIFWSCGFHPHFAAAAFPDFDFDTMVAASSDPDCVAVGEVGLDYAKSAAPPETQMALFRKTLEVCAQLKKPVIVHCREAQSDTLKILQEYFQPDTSKKSRTGVIHCFSGESDFAQGCLELGFYLGVDGPITYPSAKRLREVVAELPLERILLETDSPYLPPQPFRGQRNEPSRLIYMAEKLAELFGKSVEEVSKITTENARNLFGLK